MNTSSTSAGRRVGAGLIALVLAGVAGARTVTSLGRDCLTTDADAGLLASSLARRAAATRDSTTRTARAAAGPAVGCPMPAAGGTSPMTTDSPALPAPTPLPEPPAADVEVAAFAVG